MSPKRFLAPLAAFALVAARGDAQCLDWSAPEGAGLSNVALCSTEFAGDLVVGGSFDRADGLTVGLLARWDGARWQPLGNGVGRAAAGSGILDRVLALETFDDGTGPALYAGGKFSGAAGEPKVFNLARFDGATRWLPVGTSGIGGTVEALAVHDDGSGPALYVAGDFITAGGVAANNVARWNGVDWQPVGVGTDGPVRALHVHGGMLVAAGAFNQAGGVPGTGSVARWNGAQWEAMGNGLIPAYVPVVTMGAYALEEFDHAGGPVLYAGGQFEDPGANRFQLARWDGAQWTLLAPSTEIAGALHGHDDGTGARLYVGTSSASTPLRTFDGAAFANVPLLAASNPLGSVITLASYDDGAGTALYAGGGFTDVLQGTGFAQANHVARWDGIDWHALGSSAPDLDGPVDDFVAWNDGSGEALYAGGRFQNAGTLSLNRAARWDGIRWSSLGSGLDDNVFELALHDDGAGTALYAGGKFTAAGALPAPGVARWDGQQWSAVGGGPGGTVRAMTSFDDGGGAALYVGGGALPVRRWDGAGWSAVGANPPEARSMAVHDDGSGPALYAGFGDALQGTSGDVWKWDGTSWSSVGPADSRIGSLFSYDDGSGPALYAGGGFSTIGGAAISHVARLRAGQWEPVGAPFFTARVKSMTTYDDGSGVRLAAGSGYTAVWDGASWSWLGPLPIPGPVGSLIGLGSFGDRLFLGREYKPGVHSWGPSAECPPVLYCNPGKSTNNCAPRLQVSGRASLTLDTDLQLTAIASDGGTSGLFFFGLNGAKSTPWGPLTSRLCVRGPLQRTGVQANGGNAGQCNGILSLEFNQWMTANPGKAPGPGAGVWLQSWYPDPASPKGSYLSDAVEFYVLP